MSIQSEITRLQGVKSSILNALEDMHVVVPSNTMLDECPSLIRSIKTSGEFNISNIVPIIPQSRIYVVDDNGYIGMDITKYFQYSDNVIYHNFAILATGNDYSQKGLGQVVFAPSGTDIIGGRTYPTVTIGGKTWLAENLDFKFSGLVVGSSGNSNQEPRANYYSNDESTYGEHGNKYGLLYNWIAVKYLEDNKNTLIGENTKWRVATKADWDALANAVGGASIAGTKLKSTTGWSSGNGDGTFDFNAFPAGRYNLSFYEVGSLACFWTATQYNSTIAFRSYFTKDANMVPSDSNKQSQFSVRLVKDS